MKNFVTRKFVKFYLGRKNIYSHIDAVHACPPRHDKFTGEIVEGIVKEINCSAIIAVVSRTKADINRPRNDKNCEAIDEYRDSIRQILKHLDILDKDGKLSHPYLHLAIHGMKDEYNKDIEIGTRYGDACSENVKNWVVEEIKKSFITVGIDRKFSGNKSKSVHRLGDLKEIHNYPGYGINFNTVQLELSLNSRKNHRNKIINILSELILNFCDNFK